MFLHDESFDETFQSIQINLLISIMTSDLFAFYVESLFLGAIKVIFFIFLGLNTIFITILISLGIMENLIETIPRRNRLISDKLS